MTYLNNNTKINIKGSHLSEKEMILIEAYKGEGYSNRQIAKKLGRSHQTINNAVKKASVIQKRQVSQNSKVYVYEDVKYFADLNRRIYLENRKNCGRKPKFLTCEKFLKWADKKILEENWSVDVCVGYAKRSKLFNDNEIPSVKSMYNWIDKGLMETKNIDLELKLKRKPNKNNKNNRKNKMMLGESIETRPKEIETREEFGDWEIDTVIGSKKKTDPVIITLTERKTRYELIIKIDSKTSKAVEEGLSFLKDKSPLKEQVFKTITSDNGLEFSSLTKICEYIKIYYCHPYSSYERGTSENQHKLIRRFIKKGEEIGKYTERQIERIMNWMNNYPRKILGYMTAEEAFMKELKLIEKTSLDI